MKTNEGTENNWSVSKNIQDGKDDSKQEVTRLLWTFSILKALLEQIYKNFSKASIYTIPFDKKYFLKLFQNSISILRKFSTQSLSEDKLKN